ncbi:MAG: PAS domain S-box protein [Rhodospirillales bacterium]|nr:PAS domain S-box protein [Rhodospirillales bacterium]
MKAAAVPRRRFVALGAAIVIFIVSLAATATRLYTVETDVAREFGENLVWSVAQNETELLRFTETLRRYGEGESTAGELQRRFDLLWSRLSVPREGEMNTWLRAVPEAWSIIDRVLVELARIEPRVEALAPGDAEEAKAIAAELHALLPDLHDATLATSHAEIARLTAWSRSREQALITALFLLLGLVVSAGMLVALLLAELRSRRVLVATAEAAEAAARESEQRLRDMIEAATDWVWETDAENRFVFLSGRLRELSGEDPKRLIGRTREELRLPDDDDEANWTWYRTLMQRREPFHDFEFPYADVAGKRRWARIHGRPIYDAEGRFAGYRGTGRDITTERAATAAIAESRALLRAVIDAVPAIINVKDRDARYVLMNRFQGEMYGVDPDAAIGKTSADFTGSYGGQSREFDQEVIDTGRALPFRERKFVDAKGGRRVWWTAKTPLKDAAGVVRHIVTVALDITELKAAERARTNLARYFSPNLVELLIAKDEPIGQVRRQEVAVVFADLVDFTRLSARETPERTMMLLRDLHARLTDVVLSHGGTLEKFLGDGLMATFGTPVRGPRDASNALECTVGMIEAILSWNSQRIAAGEAPLRIGIGAHFGPVILGDVGTDRRLEYAVVGDTVNVANRLEEMTRRLGAAAVVSRALVEAARGEPTPSPRLEMFQPAAAQVIEGHDEKLEVFVLHADRLVAAGTKTIPFPGPSRLARG